MLSGSCLACSIPRGDYNPRMRRFWEFLSGSGGWGLTSALSAFVLYVIALWEHARDKPITAFILLAATLPVFCAGAYMSWLKKAVQLERIQQQLREIPRIRDVKGSFKSDVRGWGILDPTTGEHQKHEDIRSLVVSFRNDPEFRCDAANAKEVIARMEFFNIDVEQSPQRLFTRAFESGKVYARWATNPQPKPGVPTKDILATDIRIDETVELDIAVKYLHDAEAFAVSNDSWSHSLRHPRLELTGKRFLVVVKLTAVNVKETFEFRFENLGKENGFLVLA
jgi:hypothetical protein